MVVCALSILWAKGDASGKNALGASPLFRYSNEQDQKIITAPWPFIQYAEGDIDRRYLWPLGAKKASPSARVVFLMATHTVASARG